MYEKFKEEMTWFEDSTDMEYGQVKEVVINIIDMMIRQQVFLAKQYDISHGDVVITINYLKEQRKLIENYEA